MAPDPLAVAQAVVGTPVDLDAERLMQRMTGIAHDAVLVADAVLLAAELGLDIPPAASSTHTWRATLVFLAGDPITIGELPLMLGSSAVCLLAVHPSDYRRSRLLSWARSIGTTVVGGPGQKGLTWIAQNDAHPGVRATAGALLGLVRTTSACR